MYSIFVSVMPVCFQVKICNAANPLRFLPVMPCSQQPPIGFIVLCEVMRNGGIYRISVQQLHSLVNHRAVHCVRPVAKIFTNFTSIDFEAVKIGCPCTARYGRRLVYAAVRRFCVPNADSAADFTRCRELLHQRHKQNRILRMKLKNAVQSVRRVRQF